MSTDPGQLEPIDWHDLDSLDEDSAEPSGDEFWSVWPVLGHIQTFARARLVSPYAMLGVVLVRVAAAVKPFVVLPALTGSHASLNIFLALVGRSGAGKDTAIAAAGDALNVPPFVTVGIGSGEGILDQFAHWVTGEDDKGGGVEIHTDSVVFTAAEVDTLGALKNRQASTLMPEFRKAWTGTQLGHAYRTREKRLLLPPHSYRLGLIVGVQPDRAGILLDGEATASGDPQRFLWLPATDPAAPDVEPDEPDPFTWHPTAWPMASSGGKVTLNVCPTARDTIRHARRARLRDTGDAIDGHALLCRLKAAALLNILHGDTQVTDEGWDLAGQLVAISDHTRDRVRAALADKQRRDNRARGAAEAERATIVAETIQAADIQRVCRAITRKLGHAGDWVTHNELRKTLAGRDRGHFDTAVERLTDAGQIKTDEAEYHGAPTTRYQLLQDPK